MDGLTRWQRWAARGSFAWVSGLAAALVSSYCEPVRWIWGQGQVGLCAGSLHAVGEYAGEADAVEIWSGSLVGRYKANDSYRPWCACGSVRGLVDGGIWPERRGRKWFVGIEEVQESVRGFWEDGEGQKLYLTVPVRATHWEAPLWCLAFPGVAGILVVRSRARAANPGALLRYSLEYTTYRCLRQFCDWIVVFVQWERAFRVEAPGPIRALKSVGDSVVGILAGGGVRGKSAGRAVRIAKWGCFVVVVGVTVLWHITEEYQIFWEGSTIEPARVLEVCSDRCGVWVWLTRIESSEPGWRQLIECQNWVALSVVDPEGWRIEEVQHCGLSSSFSDPPGLPSAEFNAFPVNPCLPPWTCKHGPECEIKKASFGNIRIWLPYWPGLVFFGLVSLFLFWRDRRPAVRPGYCHVCCYDLRGNVSGICPECGTSVIRAREGESGYGVIAGIVQWMRQVGSGKVERLCRYEVW